MTHDMSGMDVLIYINDDTLCIFLGVIPVLILITEWGTFANDISNKFPLPKKLLYAPFEEKH